ncbi:non-ribosomal peptide synthetase, partial [Streptomyces sp. A7024]
PTLAALPTAQIGFNYLGRTPAVAAEQAEEPQDWTPLGGARGGAAGKFAVDHALETTCVVHDLADADADGDGDGPQLTLTLAWPEQLLNGTSARRLVDGWAAMLAGLAAHAGRPGSGGHTPSDFPLAGLDQAQLEELEAEYPRLAEVLPVSPLQEGLLFHALFDEQARDVYVEQIDMGLDGPLDVPVLRASWQAMLDRHASLRAGFRQLAGAEQPVQVIPERVALPWQEEDLSALGANAAAEAERLGAEERARRFDPAVPPLLKVLLVKLAPGRYRMMVTLHHILLDGWSLPILMRELWTAYAAGGTTSGLPPVSPFRHYLEWLGRQDKDAAREAWRQALAGVDEATLVAPGEPAASAATDFGRVVTQAGTEPAEALRELARIRGLTLNTLVQAAWALVIGQLTGRRDVVFGATVAGRPAELPGMADMLGLFINTVPVRVRLDPDASVAELLAELQAQQSALLDHQHLGLTEIQRLAGPGATFDTLIAFDNYPTDPDAEPDLGDLTFTDTALRESTNFPLGLDVDPADDLKLRLEYRPTALAESTVHALAERLVWVLHQMAEEPQARLGELELLGAAERSLVVEEWNDTARPMPAGTLGELFAAQVERSPGAVAVLGAGVEWSYAELDEISGRVAGEL